MAPFEGYKDWRDFTNKVCRPWVEAEHADDRRGYLIGLLNSTEFGPV